MKRILVVEDDKFISTIYKEKFLREGFEVELAGDGRVALEKVQDWKPDALLLDLMLPDIDGVEVLKRLRSEPESKNLPVLVLSNSFMGDLMKSAQDAGANGVLFKATQSPSRVVQAMREVMSKTKATAASEPSSDVDPRLQEEWQIQIPVLLREIKNLHDLFSKDPKDLRPLRDLARKIHSLAGSAGVAGHSKIAEFSSVLEAFLYELCRNPKFLTSQTRRAVKVALEILRAECEGRSHMHPSTLTPHALIVDDEEFSYMAIAHAVKKVGVKVSSAKNADEALSLMHSCDFDLIFLDVEMPDMDGFKLSAALREIPGYSKTPVIFVTGHTNLDDQTEASISGGNDFVAKPFLYPEVELKTLIHLWKRS